MEALILLQPLEGTYLNKFKGLSFPSTEDGNRFGF
jgi:hypothetical protein